MSNLKALHSRMLSLSVLFVLAASAILTAPALADSGAPPSANPSSGGRTSRGPASGSLSQVPSGTKVVVVDDEGDKLPLGSQAAQDVVSGGDPIWCPSSVGTPVSGASGCTAWQPSISALLALLTCGGCQPTIDGTIWIEKGSLLTTTTGISLDGSSLTTWATHKLTLKGGWNGLGTNTISTADPSEFTTNPISITNWKNAVTVSDIEVHNASGTGLTVSMASSSPGSISLTRVNLHNNTGSGAYLNNASGGDTGTITVTSSQFINNSGGTGLQADSNGKITLGSVTASGNTGGMGALLDNLGATSSQSVTLSGDNTFENNSSYGLEIWSIGAVTVNDVTATDNGSVGGDTGVWIDNCQFISTACTGSGAVTLTGTSILTGNYGGGLYVYSNGAIKANNLIADSNPHGYGAFLNNSDAAAAQPITLTGSSLFKFDQSYGLHIITKGAVTLSNITGSYDFGSTGAVYVENYLGTAGVTLTGTNLFNGNGGTGLYVDSSGAVNLNNITADCNGYSDNCITGAGGYGVNISNSSAKPVTLNGVNTLDDNYWSGLYITSKGAVTLNNITSSGARSGDGADVDNCQLSVSCAGSGAITLNGTNAFNNNSGHGVSLTSNGAITLNNITADCNGYVSGCGGSASGGYGASLDNSNASAAQAVTFKGTNAFNDNYGTGLQVTSRGTITVSNATADGNALGAGYGFGLSLDNTAGSAGVTLTGTNEMDANYSYGLNILTHGAVAINNLTANDSANSDGLYLYFTGQQNVTLTGTNVFDGNHTDGLDITTLGQISLSNITASGNGNGTSGYGANLYNYGGSPKDVILNGTNTFSNNGADGLEIGSLGNIKLNNLTASCNGYSDSACTVALVYGTGVNIDDCQWNGSMCAGTGSITLSGNNIFTGNLEDGLLASSGHAIKVNNITSTDNGLDDAYGYGAELMNNSASTPQSVTLTGVNNFNHNYSGGLLVWSAGSITASNLNASNTAHGDGLDLYNNFGPASSSVAALTLTGASVVDGNSRYGLEAGSYGAISINTTSFDASCNGYTTGCSGSGAGGYGVYLDNGESTAPTSPSITMKGIYTANQDYSGGLWLQSKGAISVNSVTADGSPHGTGAQLANGGSTTGQGITLTGTNVFNDNLYGGLDVGSKGAITLNNITADCNGFNAGCSGAGSNYGGLSVDNSTAGSAKTVTLSGVNTFNNNDSDGLDITSLGTISASNVTASYDGAYGISLDNHTGSGGVTLSGINDAFGDSFSYGINVDIHTTGNVNLTDLTSDGSTGTGLYIEPNAANVTLTCGSFTNNAGNGINVNASGTLTWNGGVASGNGASDYFPLLSAWNVVTRNCP